jgi:spore maturation protein CgeB
LHRHPLVRKNLEALAASGQHAAVQWLGEAPASGSAELTDGADGLKILSVNGQAQASRYNPQKEAAQWLEKFFPAGGVESPLLFGLGSPWLAAGLLEKTAALFFEPDPLVVLAAFSLHDFSRFLAEGRMRLVTPWQLAEGSGDWPRATLLIHPPAQRREGAQLVNLKRALGGPGRDLSRLAGRAPRIMIIPPLSGGSWPVAVALARAAEINGYPLLFLDWGPGLRDLEAEAQKTPPDESLRLTARLFEQTAPRAAAAAAEFQPDLIVALAQAPLDAPGLARLRETGEAALAFWLVEDVRNFGYVAQVAPSYDALFHIQPGLIEPTLRDWGLRRAWYLPLAADPDVFRPLPPNFANSLAADLSFMGAGYPNRRKVLGGLAANYWPKTGRPAESFKVFGSGWAGADPALRAHLHEGGRRVTLPECALIYAGGRVNLNLHSSVHSMPGFDPESRFVNPRTFEIAAAGALQLVDPRPLLPELFEAGREVVVAESPEKLPELIDYYLAHPEAAEAIGQAARARVLAEHTYSHRLERMLACLGR